MFRDFMRGRYGVDTLSLVILFMSLLFVRGKYSWIIGIGLLAVGFFRILSKDVNKRYLERQKFEKILKQIRNKFTSIKTRFEQRKQYVFIKCKKCKNTLRLPKHKGKLQCTCPVCKFEFFIKT